MMLVYEVIANSDPTEGRGHEISVALFEREEDAIEYVKERKTPGFIYNEVYAVPVFSGPVHKNTFGEKPFGLLKAMKTKIWGHRINWRGVWDYGYLDNRDAPTNDPEYSEYQRLKAKFES